MTLKKIKVKLNRDFKGFKADRIIELECDGCGIPTDLFWRRRLKDSKFDNCVEVVTSSSKSSNKKSDKKKVTQNDDLTA